MDVSGLTPVEQTALLTEYARALDSRQTRPILADPFADRVVANIDFDFAALGVIPSVRCLVALRARMLDDRVRGFVTSHPDAVVVDLGAGLNSAVFRIDPPPTVDWFSVDLPAMIGLREMLLPPREGTHTVSASVAEPGWADRIPADRPAMVIADGLFAFLTEPVVIEVLGTITDHFETGVIAFNDYGPVSRANRVAGKLITAGKQAFRRGGTANSPHSQWGFPGFKNASQPVIWNPELTLLEEASVMLEPDSALFPPLLRLGSRLAAHVPAIARKARILQYRF